MPIKFLFKKLNVVLVTFFIFLESSLAVGANALENTFWARPNCENPERVVAFINNNGTFGEYGYFPKDDNLVVENFTGISFVNNFIKLYKNGYYEILDVRPTYYREWERASGHGYISKNGVFPGGLFGKDEPTPYHYKCNLDSRVTQMFYARLKREPQIQMEREIKAEDSRIKAGCPAYKATRYICAGAGNYEQCMSIRFGEDFRDYSYRCQ